MKGWVEIFDPNGRLVLEGPNVITNQGLDLMTFHIKNAPNAANPLVHYLGYGTGVTIPAATDTTLDNEVSTPVRPTVDGAPGPIGAEVMSPGVVTWKFSNKVGGVATHLTEFGLFTQDLPADPNNIMLARFRPPGGSVLKLYDTTSFFSLHWSIQFI